jgi:hypothetical protein
MSKKRGGAVKTRATERRKLVKALDAVCREWVMKHFDRCVCCGSTEYPQCGHLFSRVAYSTRWDKRNLYRQDRGCNMTHEYDPMPLLRYAERVWGREEIDRLHADYSKPRKFSNPELAALLEERRAELK